MKKKLLLSVFLLMPFQAKSGLFDDYFNKLWAFFLIQMAGTFVHECGHATIILMNEGLCNIYVGVSSKKHVTKSSDGRVNFVSCNPYAGFTRPTKAGLSRSRTMMCQTAAFGPFYGIIFNLMLYEIFGVLQHRFSPSLFNSIRTYVLVQALKEFCYGAIPLSATGDTNLLYTRSKLLSQERYKAAAASNFKALKAYAQLCLVINCLTKVINTVASTEVIDKIKKENANFLFIYKITSSYALQYGLLGGLANTALKVSKEESNRTRGIKEKETGPTPADWLGGLLVSPLII